MAIKRPTNQRVIGVNLKDNIYFYTYCDTGILALIVSQ